jgi:hypothetical protein
MAEQWNKHIRAAIEYAVAHGWTVRKSGPRAHVWGRLFCPLRTRDGCAKAVYSTPKTRKIIRRIRGEPWTAASMKSKG